MSDTEIGKLVHELCAKLDVVPEGDDPVHAKYGPVDIEYFPLSDELLLHRTVDAEEDNREQVRLWQDGPDSIVSYFNPDPMRLPVVDLEQVRASNSSAVLASFIEQVNNRVDQGAPSVYYSQKVPAKYLLKFAEHFAAHFTHQLQTVLEV